MPLGRKPRSPQAEVHDRKFRSINAEIRNKLGPKPERYMPVTELIAELEATSNLRVEVAVRNAYPIRAQLKAAGYSWDGEAWTKTFATVDESIAAANEVGGLVEPTSCF